MGIKKYKPTTPGLRWAALADFSELTKGKPEKGLLAPLKKSGGRGNTGRVTSRHRGGGHKRMYRIVDFKRDKLDVTGKVMAIEYDPNRSARLALLQYSDGEKRYIIAPVGINVNDELMSGKNVEIKVGNAAPLETIPPGIPIHNVEFKKGSGARIARSAGNSCIIMAKEGGYAHVKLPSGEIRLIGLDCYATIGQVGNIEHEAISIGKAGRSRWLGKRPYSRGVAKNPHDHPMGGGEGKASGGLPRSPWGQYAKGLKTRHHKKHSSKYIVKRRK
ncbi:MAG: 50S ribosomal protein L2 [Candidatus Omnitrophota bacterium]|nr:50S ribosomal protein L2 [Candidatus Omnitrophota bacterium]